MADEHAPVTFRDWKERLAAEPWAPAIKQQTARDIIGFLRHCKELHGPASIVVAKSYIAQREAQVRNPAASPRTALRWFFVAAKKSTVLPVPEMSAPPRSVMPAAPDGGPDWRGALVAAVRTRHLLARTEETYLQWAVRFAKFIAPASPYRATEREVQAFLTDLAVRQQVSPPTQKQAA